MIHPPPHPAPSHHRPVLVYKAHLNIAHVFTHVWKTSPSHSVPRTCCQLFMAFYLQQFSWRYPCIICCSSFSDPESARDLHAFVVWFTVCVSNHIQTQWLVLMRLWVACLVWMGRVSLCDIVYVFFVRVLSFQCFVLTQLSCTDHWVKWNLP